MIREKLEEFVTAQFSDKLFLDCYLVDLVIKESQFIKVFVDADDGITLDRCAKLNRLIRSYVEEHIKDGEKYKIEVSSPGLDRPLTLLRQYKKNIGRKFEIKEKSGTVKKGLLREVDGDFITIEYVETVKQGKKKIKEKRFYKIPFEEIAESFVKPNI